MAKLHIQKDDTVYVLAGDDKGKTGRVLSIDHKNNRAIVEGVNKIKKSTKPNAQYPQGGIIEKEAPIHISNLMLICPETGKPTRIGRKVVEDSNGVKRLVRYSKKSKDQKEIK